MRDNIRKQREQDEEESVFVSMTDMTVSFLFIVILLLAYFATHYSGGGETVPKSKYETLVAENTELKRKLKHAEDRVTLLEGDISLLKARVSELELIIAEQRKVDPLEEYLSKAATAR